MKSLENHPTNPKEREGEERERGENIMKKVKRDILNTMRVRLSLILNIYPKIRIFFEGIILHTTLR